MRAIASAVGAALLLAAGVARADGLADPEADRLFKDGQDLLEHGQVHEACDKFDLSLRREQNLNTLALLALCHERDNKPGKAWNEFKRAERDAPPGDKAQIVAQHLRALESKVARARLEVGPRNIREVLVDNEPVLLDQGRLVTDPGLHTITVKVEGAGGVKVVTRNAKLDQGDNPDLLMEASDSPPRAGETPPPADDGNATRRLVGFGLIGAGVIAVTVGTVVGVNILGKRGEPDDTCYGEGYTGSKTGPCVSAQQADAANARRHDLVIKSWISTGTIAGGAAAAGIGLYLVLTASGVQPVTYTTGSVRVRPEIGPRSLGLSGSF